MDPKAWTIAIPKLLFGHCLNSKSFFSNISYPMFMLGLSVAFAFSYSAVCVFFVADYLHLQLTLLFLFFVFSFAADSALYISCLFFFFGVLASLVFGCALLGLLLCFHKQCSTGSLYQSYELWLLFLFDIQSSPKLVIDYVSFLFNVSRTACIQ